MTIAKWRYGLKLVSGNARSVTLRRAKMNTDVQYAEISTSYSPFMNNKLTLRMDESLIASAKDYAASHGSSVSQMVANYFAAITQGQTATVAQSNSATLPRHQKPASTSGPVTRSLAGILKPATGQKPVSEDDYRAYLERKHTGGSPEQSL